MVQFIPAKDDWADAFRQIGSGLSKGYMNRSDENSVRKAIMDLGPNASARDILNTLTSVKTYGNEAKQEALKNYLGVENFEEMKRKAKVQEDIAKEKNQVTALKNQGQQDRDASIANFIAQGFTKDEAEALTNPHVPNSVKQGISKRAENEIGRNLRQQGNQTQQDAIQATQQEKTLETTAEIDQGNQLPLEVEEAVAPVDQAIEKVVEQVPIVEKPEWPEIPLPEGITHAEKEKFRDKNQAFNNKLLKETKDKTNSHTNALIRYNRLTTLNDSKKLPSGMGRLVIDPETGEPYPTASLLGLVNKETQDFVKTMNDFLIDAKNYFGSRVTNFDVNAFKSRLPTLLNTDEGRRLIIEQMKLMEELQIVHDKELERGLKNYGRNASYSDIQKVVDEKTEEKEQQIIEKVNNLDKATQYMQVMANNPKYKDTTLMQDPKTGKFKAFRPGEVNQARSKGWIKW